MQPRWDMFSVALYCMMAFVGTICASQAKISKKNRHKKNEKLYYVVWFTIWVLFASLRYVAYRIGGTDASSYVYFFENINSRSLPIYYQHYDKGFWMFTRMIRLFTFNYHIYFIVFYGILMYCYIKFIDEFSVFYGVYISYFMIFFLYLRGFTSFRTNLSVAFLLLALVYLKKKQKFKLALFLIIACSMHKATVLYALFIVFYLINKRKPITIRTSVIFSFIAGIVGLIVRNYIGLLFDSRIDAYGSYAKSSIGVSFFDNFWKIAFGQLALMIMMILFNKDIMHLILQGKKDDRKKILLLRTICMYDFVLIPITFILNIWRGYEYFYIPRLAMWGIVMRIELQKLPTGFYRKIYKVIIYIAIISWFVFRLYNTWEDSSLLPYIINFSN